MAAALGEQYLPDIDFGTETQSGSSKKAVIVTAIAMLAVLAIGFLAYTTLTQKTPKPVYAAGGTLTLSQTTLNLSDNHLLQVQLVLQLSKTADTASINSHNPQIMDAMIAVFGSMTSTQLETEQGKEQAKQQLITAFENIVGKSQGFPQIMGIYFTDFVMQ